VDSNPSFARRLLRAFFALPGWLRPGVLCASIVLALMSVRVLAAVPDLLRGRGTLLELAAAFGAAGAAAFVGGLVHGVSRPLLRRLGAPGDYLSGVVLMYGYLGSLMLASPFVFERSAIPKSLSDAAIWLGMSTVLGLFAGHFWFAGPDGLDRINERRSLPRVQRLTQENGAGTATLVSGWIPRHRVADLLGEVARELGGRLPPGEAERIDQALSALPDDDENGLEWRLNEPSLLVHFAPDEALVDLDVLLEGELERNTEAVHAIFRARTVDPLKA
jgi:hypothetical protein